MARLYVIIPVSKLPSATCARAVGRDAPQSQSPPVGASPAGRELWPPLHPPDAVCAESPCVSSAGVPKGVALLYVHMARRTCCSIVVLWSSKNPA